MTVAEKWDAIYQHKSSGDLTVATVLRENLFLLPEQGVALELACGLGANALLLVERGLTVQAWDISAVAIEKLQQQAHQQNLTVQAKQVDIRPSSLPENSFDVIVISRFLDRSLCRGIIAALKAGGLVFYQTYTRQKLTDSPPHNPDFLLAGNELLTLFTPLKTLVYQEHGLVGNLNAGERNEALYIGQQCRGNE